VTFCHGACDALAQQVDYHEAFNAYPEVLQEHPHPNQILPEQKAALDILEQMYMRTLYITHFSDKR
jgi:hypothetical protein